MFQHDMRQLFQNIFTYYPSDHPAMVKAYELKALFEDKWETAKTRLR